MALSEISSNLSLPILNVHFQDFRSEKSLSGFNLPSDLNWESIFPAQKKKKKKRIRKKMLKGSESRPLKVSKTTPKPSAIFFPTNENEGCGEITAGRHS